MGSTCSCWDHDKKFEEVQSIRSQQNESKIFSLDHDLIAIISEYESLPSLPLPLPSSEHSIVNTFKNNQVLGFNSPTSGRSI